MSAAAIVMTVSFLLISSVQDIKSRKISLWVVVGFGLSGVILLVWEQNFSFLTIAGLLPGILLILLAVISDGNLGIGDGLIFLAAGIYMGGIRSLILLFCASLLASIFGVCLMLLFHKNRKTRLPFVPFVALAYACITIAEYL